MIKNLPVAAGLGAGFWAVMFIGISALMVSGLPELAQQILGVVLAGVAGFILGKVYFKKNPGDLKAGIILIILWLIISTILDLLITVQFVKASGTYMDGLVGFYTMWSLWVGFILMAIGVIVSAKLTHGGELMKKPASQPAVKTEADMVKISPEPTQEVQPSMPEESVEPETPKDQEPPTQTPPTV